MAAQCTLVLLYVSEFWHFQIYYIKILILIYTICRALNLVFPKLFVKGLLSKEFSFLVEIRLQTVYSIFLLFTGFRQQNLDFLVPIKYTCPLKLDPLYVWVRKRCMGCQYWGEMGEIYFCLQLRNSTSMVRPFKQGRSHFFLFFV